MSTYADDWRRANLEPDAQPHQARRARSLSKGPTSRPGVLEGLISHEDSAGERKIARGLDRAELARAISSWSRPSGTTEECAICLVPSDPQAKAPPLELPCGHTFCAECVVPWLQKCSLCPMCRRDLRSKLEAPRASSTSAASSRHTSTSAPEKRPLNCVELLAALGHRPCGPGGFIASSATSPRSRRKSRPGNNFLVVSNSSAPTCPQSKESLPTASAETPTPTASLPPRPPAAGSTRQRQRQVTRSTGPLGSASGLPGPPGGLPTLPRSSTVVGECIMTNL